jgi:hypothetical protein
MGMSLEIVERAGESVKVWNGGTKGRGIPRNRDRLRDEEEE